MEERKDGRRAWRRAGLAVGCLLAALATALVAAGGGGGGADATAATGAPPAQQVVRVEHVKRDRWAYARARFNEMCAGCHSLQDAGATGPRYNLDRAGGLNEERVRYAVAEGEPGMPPWKDVLSYREYEELVAYVSTVELNEEGEDDWLWQIKMREAGNAWTPEDPR